MEFIKQVVRVSFDKLQDANGVQYAWDINGKGHVTSLETGELYRVFKMDSKGNPTHIEDAAAEENRVRKQKHPRINMAFYGDNLDYVREAAWKNRKSVTQYINDLIAKDRFSNGEDHTKPVELGKRK